MKPMAMNPMVPHGAALVAAAAAVALSALSLDAFAREKEPRRLDCAELTQLAFPGNTTVTAAAMVTTGTLVTPTNITLTDLPEFCRVQGVSKPSSDSNIYYEVWLPTQWNGRFLSSGEGGYVGALNYTRRGLDGGLDEIVRRGYATTSTDTGHVATDTYWAVGHPERAKDYLYRAKHLVTVAAKGLIAALYGRPARYSYFNSCSNGGRQALMEAQRYPDDYDGYVVGAPWNFQSHSNAGFVWNAQALSAPGAAIQAAKLPATNSAVLAACDAKDGLADGVIANPAACRFNPDTLACPAGTDTNSCLTPPQLTALKKIYAGPGNPRTGRKIFPGFAVGGELAWTGLVTNPTAAGLSNGYFANLTFEDPAWDHMTFDFDHDMALADRKVGSLGNSIETDLSPARRRGAKFIQYHGWNDQTLQPAYSPQYYEAVTEEMGGLRRTQEFYRLFMVPGMTHCYFGPGATSFGGVGQQIPPARDAQHDIQKALEAWVERGIAPDRIIATKYTDDAAATRTILLQRPLCRYPQVAEHKGQGDPNDAANFACRVDRNHPRHGDHH